MKNKKSKDKMRKNMFWIFTILSILLLANLIFSLVYFGAFESVFSKDNHQEIFEENLKNINLSLNESEALSLEGFVEIDMEVISEESGILISKEDKCKGLIVAIDPTQSYSIQQGLESKVNLRPTSHDTARDILDQYGIEVVMIKITDIRENAYIGRMILDDGKKIANLDVRPSDGVAIAVRTNSPIYLSKEILEEFGDNIC